MLTHYSASVFLENNRIENARSANISSEVEGGTIVARTPAGNAVSDVNNFEEIYAIARISVCPSSLLEPSLSWTDGFE